MEKSKSSANDLTVHAETVPTNHQHHSALAALADVETESVDFRWDRAVIVNLASLYFAWFVTAYTNANASSSLAYVAQRFPSDADQIGWISTAPYVVATVLIVPLGELSDLVGRKVFVCICMVAGLVGNIITGTASTFGAAVGGQAIAGAALVFAYLPAPLTQEMVPKLARPIVAGVGGFIVGIGYIIAPIIEGVVIERAYGGENEGWRVGYYIAVGLYAVALAGVLLFYTPAPRPNPTGTSKLRRLFKIDWIGTILLAAGISLFLVGISGGGTVFPWDSATTICLTVIGAVCLVGLVVWNWIGTSEGIFPHCLFEHRNFGLSMIVRGIGSFAQIGCQAYLPQLIVRVFTSNGIEQAVWYLPFTVSLIVGSFCAGVGVRMTREIRWLAVLSMVFIALGGGLLSIVKPGINFAGWFFPAALVGFGIGVEAQIMYLVAGLCTPDHLIGTALMVASLSGTFCGAVGIVMFGAIYNAKLKTALPSRISAAVVEAGFPVRNLGDLLKAFATQSPAAIEAVPGVTPKILEALDQAAKSAYAYSFHNVWYSLMAFAIVTAGISIFIKTTRHQMTDVVAAPVSHRLMHEKAEGEVETAKE